MFQLRRLFSVGVGLLASVTSTFALAVPFTPLIDEFWILQGGSEIFRDSFNNGIPPPSGPDGPTTYFVSGPAGITGESAGRLTLTPSLGTPTAITSSFSDRFTGATTPASLDPGTPTLPQQSSFEIHGLFDMSGLPTVPGQTFGIRATDRATGNAGDNTYSLFVGVSQATGNVVVALRLLDFASDTTTLIQAASIQSLLAEANQVELILSKEMDLDELTAFARLYRADGTVLAEGPLGAGTALPIYIGEDYIRAQFFATDRVPIPEPATLALLGVALAGLGFSRRRKRGHVSRTTSAGRSTYPSRLWILGHSHLET